MSLSARDALRTLNDPGASQADVDAAKAALEGQGGGGTPARSPHERRQAPSGWRLVDARLGIYEGPDGRSYQLDLSRGVMRLEGRSARSMGGGPRQTLVLGLGGRPRAGVVLERPRQATREEQAALDGEIARLEGRRRTAGLTTAEAARLNHLRRVRAGGDPGSISVGLPGARVTVDRHGTRQVEVGARGRTLHGPITGIEPRTEQERGFVLGQLNERAAELRRLILDLEARMASGQVIAGTPDLVARLGRGKG